MFATEIGGKCDCLSCWRVVLAIVDETPAVSCTPVVAGRAHIYRVGLETLFDGLFLLIGCSIAGGGEPGIHCSVWADPELVPAYQFYSKECGKLNKLIAIWLAGYI